MRVPKTVSFTNPQLFQEIEDYAKSRSIDFSQAVSELSEAGLALYKKTGSLNLDSLAMLSGLQVDVDHLKTEVEKLWSILLKEGKSHKQVPSKFTHYRKMNLNRSEVGEAYTERRREK